MKPPGQSNPSPRPESTSSCASVQSNTSALFHCGKKGEDDICVGEELKIAVATAIERFRLSEDQRGIYMSTYQLLQQSSVQCFGIIPVEYGEFYRDAHI